MTGPSPDGAGDGRRRAVGWLALLLVLASFPMGAGGLFLYWVGDSSEGGGPTAGLSAFPMMAGIGLMVLAVIAFVVGGIFYIRSAKD